MTQYLHFTDEALTAYHTVIGKTVTTIHQLGLPPAPEVFIAVSNEARQAVIDDVETMTVHDEELLDMLLETLQAAIRAAAESAS